MQSVNGERDEVLRTSSLKAYAEYVDELLRLQLINNNIDDIVFSQFWESIGISSPRCIGTWINSRFDELQVTHQTAADRLKVDRSAVTKWVNKGGISLTKFLGIFIRFRVIELFPNLVEDVRIEGYLGAISYIQGFLTARAEGRSTSVKPNSRKWPWSTLINPSIDQSLVKRLDRERYLCLARLFGSGTVRVWAEAQAGRDMRRLESIANEILKYVSVRTGREPSLKRVRDLEDLIREWGNAWLICHRIIDEGLFDEDTIGRHD